MNTSRKLPSNEDMQKIGLQALDRAFVESINAFGFADRSMNDTSVKFKFDASVSRDGVVKNLKNAGITDKALEKAHIFDDYIRVDDSYGRLDEIHFYAVILPSDYLTKLAPEKKDALVTIAATNMIAPHVNNLEDIARYGDKKDMPVLSEAQWAALQERARRIVLDSLEKSGKKQGMDR
jgi:hypothetical protein